MLPDLPEQFGPPDSAPPFLSRLMEAIETKGTRDTRTHTNTLIMHCNASKVLLLWKHELDDRFLWEEPKMWNKFPKQFLLLTPQQFESGLFKQLSCSSTTIPCRTPAEDSNQNLSTTSSERVEACLNVTDYSFIRVFPLIVMEMFTSGHCLPHTCSLVMIHLQMGN